ncbi:hypothetical protein [Neisseria meningitidis]|uniref:hypothetical protein n=1 Tax=Neisseria meningitidis TaxID=487 RepID=UPI00117F88A5|nr:hypothetical protein [Neisseria meningitidis]
MESKETVLSGKFPCRRVWIPAFAGMTAVGWFGFFRWIPVALRFWIPAFAGMTVGGVSVFSDKVLLRCVAGFLRSRE